MPNLPSNTPLNIRPNTPPNTSINTPINTPLPIARLGEKVLSQKAQLVPFEDFDKCRSIVDQMLYTLDYEQERVGLAAPQVFISKQIVIFRVPEKLNERYHNTQVDKVEFTVMINPTWRPLNDEMEDGWEGCLSVPGIMGIVPRYSNIEYEFYDLDGNFHKRKATGFHSRVVQHECDHLDGFSFVHRMKDLNSLAYEDVVVKNGYKVPS